VTYDNATSDTRPAMSTTGAEEKSSKRQRMSDQDGHVDGAIVDATADTTIVSGPISMASLATGITTTGKLTKTV
jgi:hypothetical protein